LNAGLLFWAQANINAFGAGNTSSSAELNPCSSVFIRG
jgi:hypothetical protein